MTDDRERWALILGASSGMGEATAIALAQAGYDIVGIHLDFRAGMAHVEEVKARIAGAGRDALYINMNAADDEKRASAIAAIEERFSASRAAGRRPYLRTVMHSLAFGSLLPFIADDPKRAISRKQLEMTLDVMANSLVYWVQDLLARGAPRRRASRVFAMTSSGGTPASCRSTAPCRRRRRRSSRTCASWRSSSPARHGGHRERDPGRGHRTPASMKIPEHQAIIEARSAATRRAG